LPQAASLAENILRTFGNQIESLTLIPSRGGVFEVELNNELVHSKKDVGAFPDEGKILEIIQQQMQ